MATPLFTSDDASDPGYLSVRDGTEPRLKMAKAHCEYLWVYFERHADKEFRTALRRTFDARYWEMYLTMSLILSGYEVTCPRPGPRPQTALKYREQGYRTLLLQLLDQPLSSYWRLAQDPCCINEIDVVDWSIRVRRINETQHLREIEGGCATPDRR
jgi:hypothetical protein